MRFPVEIVTGNLHRACGTPYREAKPLEGSFLRFAYVAIVPSGPQYKSLTAELSIEKSLSLQNLRILNELTNLSCSLSQWIVGKVSISCGCLWP
jgi:hypothetical protein